MSAVHLQKRLVQEPRFATLRARWLRPRLQTDHPVVENESELRPKKCIRQLLQPYPSRLGEGRRDLFNHSRRQG